MGLPSDEDVFAERRQIVELWKSGKAAVLATLVAVEGSSYRRPGARLLIAHDGTYAGAISGGCLEAEVLRKAKWLVRKGACVQRYSTLFDDTTEMPYGLGCGGAVDVLLEPTDTAEFSSLMHAMANSLNGVASEVMTRLPVEGQELHRSISAPDGLASEAEDVFGVFTERIDPPQRLLVFGAGDDAQPLVRMAALLGWTVLVVDGRPQWARAERFPEAQQVVLASDWMFTDVTERDAAVVMTHSYQQDRACLLALLPRAPRYLGLLGARHRSALLLSEAATALDWELARTSARVFAPIGLDLGGDGAEVIALSVVSEIQACVAGRLPAERRMTTEMIASQLELGGSSRYVQAHCAL